MNEDQLEGKEKQGEGKVQEVLGDVKEKAGDLEDKASEAWGDAKNKLSEVGDGNDEAASRVAGVEQRTEDDPLGPSSSTLTHP